MKTKYILISIKNTDINNVAKTIKQKTTTAEKYCMS